MHGGSQQWDVAIVGGGAAGLATGIFAGRRLPGRRIVILDGAARIGAKIRVSGGGRCNVTNTVVEAGDFWGGSPHLIRRVLAAFSAADAVAFFAELGVTLHEEEHGKLFPDSNRAATVVEALLAELRRLGVTILTGHRVTSIAPTAGGGLAVTEAAPGSRALTCGAVVLATGGRSLPRTGSDGLGYELAARLGHTVVPTTPALVGLVLDADLHAGLAGISQNVDLRITSPGSSPVRLNGAMLWTHFGASGPVIMNASRHWHRARLEGRACTLTVDFLPGDDFERAERRLLDAVQAQPRQSLRRTVAEWMPARVADALLDRAGVDGGIALHQLSRERRRAALQALVAFTLPVRDSRGYGHAEVTAGGVPLDEIDTTTMASRRCPGLYLVGEILDVDGRIGGYNFQWSWSSAAVAAAGLARALSASTGPSSLRGQVPSLRPGPETT